MSTQTCAMRVAEYVKQNHMLDRGDRILAAVSGGADSVCLLVILKEISETFGIHLEAFHMNHGLRGKEADRDEAYVKKLCDQLGIPLKTVQEQVAEYAAENHLSEEEAGRILRYEHLAQTAEEFSCSKIAVAHHKDDDIETILMNLFRGSGLKGLGGIRPVRGNIIRPLLCLTREEIESYLNDKKVLWCEDSTNQEIVYARNKVRNVLVPWLKKNVNPQTGEHILKTSVMAAQADEYFETQADKILKDEETAALENGKTENGNRRDISRIRIEVFDRQPEILKSYLIRRMIVKTAGKEKDLSVRHIEAVCELTGPGGGTEVHLPYGLIAIRGYQWIEIRPQKNLKNEQAKKRIEPAANSFLTQVFAWKKGLEIPKKQYTKWFDYDKIENTLSIRTREPGDFIMIGNGKTKKINRFFIDEKIPEELRDHIPLLADGHHILWIVGYRISDYYKLSDTTRMVLEVRVDKGENYV